MIIDVHVHAFPDFLAVKALEKLVEHSGPYKPFTDGTIGALDISMMEAGINISFIANIATQPDQTENILKWSKSIHTTDIIPLGSIHPTSVNWKNEIDRTKWNNLPGFKFHPMYQNFSIDDRSMYPIYEYISSKNLFILMHAGYDIAFPNDRRASSDKIKKVIGDFPDLKMIAAHLGGWQEWEDVYKNLIGRDIYLETSFINEVDEKLRDMILKKHDENLIVFGSDSPWQEQKAQVQCIYDLKVSDEFKDKVLYKNAMALIESIDYKRVRY